METPSQEKSPSRLHLRLTLQNTLALDQIRILSGNENATNSDIVRYSLLCLLHAEELSRIGKLAFQNLTTGRKEAFRLGSLPLTSNWCSPEAGTLQVGLSGGLSEQINRKLREEGTKTTAIVRYAIELCRSVLKHTSGGYEFGIITDSGFHAFSSVFALIKSSSSRSKAKSRNSTKRLQETIEVRQFSSDEVLSAEIIESLMHVSVPRSQSQTGDDSKVFGDGTSPISATEFHEVFSQFSGGTFYAIDATFNPESKCENLRSIAERIQQTRLTNIDRAVYLFNRPEDYQRASTFFSDLAIKSNRSVKAAIKNKLVFLVSNQSAALARLPVFLGKTGGSFGLVQYEQICESGPTLLRLSHGNKNRLISDVILAISRQLCSGYMKPLKLKLHS